MQHMIITLQKICISKNLFLLEGEGAHLFKDIYGHCSQIVLDNKLKLVVLKADLSEKKVATKLRNQLDDHKIPYALICRKFICIETSNISSVFSKTDFGHSMDIGAFVKNPSKISIKSSANIFARIKEGFKSQHTRNLAITNKLGPNEFLLSTLEMPFFRIYTKCENTVDLLKKSIEANQS